MPLPPTPVAKIVQAGAGTGKTESLAREIISVAEFFYNRDKIPPRLVATTFTERATAELRERVIQIVEKDPHSPQWLKDFVQNAECLQISTIHGVFARILHRYGALLGLDPEFTVISQDEEDILLSKTVRQQLSKEELTSLLVQQYGFDDSAQLATQLIEHYRNHKKAAKPFVNWEKTAAETLAEFFQNLDSLGQITEDDLSDKLKETLQKLSALKDRLSHLKLEYGPSRDAIIKSLSGVRAPAIQKKGQSLKPYLDKIFELKKQLETESFNPVLNKKHTEITKIFEGVARLLNDEMGKAKAQMGVLSFSDLEFLLTDLLEHHPSVQAQMKNYYDFWFIDEYQDTSPLQKNLLFNFFRKPFNAYVVGDPQQSIYLFRGADQNVFEDTKNAFLEQGGEFSVLEKNYRSEPDLLAFMNQIFPPLKGKGEPVGKILTDIHLHGKEVDENSLIIRQIIQWKKEDFNFHDMTVLVRTNTQARDVSHALERAGIPVFIHTTGGFYDKREIWDALSLLGFLLNTSDNRSLVTLLRSPWINIPDQEILNWAQEGGDHLWKWMEETKPQAFKDFYGLGQIKEAMERLHQSPLSFVFESLLESLGFFEFCLIHDSSGKREANVRKLVSHLRRQEIQPGFSASRYLHQAWRQIEDGGQEGEAASFIEPRRVNIMTIHKSKGLKFNCVIIPRCGDAPRIQHKTMETSPSGLWAVQVLAEDREEKESPLTLKQLKEKRGERELAESHRLFYVAVTRAAFRLSLLSSDKISEDSWLSFIKLDLSQGEHNKIYRVTNWPSSPDEVSYSQDVVATSHWNGKEIEKYKKAPPVALPHLNLEKDVSLSFLIKAQQYGVALHYIFEEIKRFPQDKIEKITRRAEERFGLKNEISPVIIEKTLKMTEPPIKKIIENGFSEWSFSFKHKDRVFSGRLDLWGEADGNVWIVDYKSAGSLTRALSAKVTQQLEFYAVALNKAGHPWEKIKPVVVLPKSQEVKIIPLREKEKVIADLDRRLLDLIQDQTSSPN